MSIKQWVVMGLFLASGLAEAASPIVKGVFVDATTGAYLKGPVYVSKQGNDGNGGTSWDDAKLTIQAGVEAAIALGAGTTVLVGPGTYSDVSPTASADGNSTPTVVNLRSVKLYLKSSEGKEKTIILGQYGDQSNGCGTGARRCVYSDVAGNVVDGFTLKNGATVVTTFGNDSKCCGGAICAASDGGIDNSKGYTSSAQVWILYSDIVDCRAGRGAAFGRGVVSIGCHVTGCTAVDTSCTLAYRSYNHYNDVYEGNGAGSGGLLSHASGCAALNCTFIGNNSDTAYGAAASERCWVFNCALIANRYEAAAATRCVVSNCVTTFGETLYATTPGCVGGVSKYQVYSPVAGDFQPVAGSALIGAGSKDAIADWGAKWVPSDYIALDFYGNPRPYGAGDSVDVGAVQSSANPPAFGCGRICLDNTCTAATFGGRTYRAKTATYGTSWLGLAAHPLVQIRFTCDRAAGEAVYAYEVIGYDSAMTQKFSVNMYPDSRTDEGVYINPPNGDIPTYSVAAKKATDIKWADPTRDDYSGADGSEAKPQG